MNAEQQCSEYIENPFRLSVCPPYPGPLEERSMAQLTIGMTANRQRSAWILLAVAAIAVVTLARAQDGMPNAAAYTNPVLQFLSGHSNTGALSPAGIRKKR